MKYVAEKENNYHQRVWSRDSARWLYSIILCIVMSSEMKKWIWLSVLVWCVITHHLWL